MNKIMDDKIMGNIMDNKAKILSAHNRQLQLFRLVTAVGYNTPIGKLLRLGAYYMDALIMLKAWTAFLNIRWEAIGNQFFAVDQAIMHADHAEVKALMQTQPQVRGNDLGIIRILAPSYLLNHPLSLGMNGVEHTGVRAVLMRALPDPLQQAETIAPLIEQRLLEATKRGQLHIGKDLPRMMLWILHQLVFQMELSEPDITASNAYLEGLALASLPNFISQYLLAFKTAPNIRHRQQIIDRYQQTPIWTTYQETGAPYGVNDATIANSLFDMIHIAGTAGTSALLGSVIGVLCLDESLRSQVISEVNLIWTEGEPPTGSALEQATLLQTVILETARLYPPVRFVSQMAQAPGEAVISASKCPFQQGTRLLGSIFTANRDATKYRNPEQFDLSRDFSDLLSWNGTDHERVCPGRALSIGIIQLFCFYLFKHYQWDSFTSVKWDFEKVTAVTPNDLVLQGFARQQ